MKLQNVPHKDSVQSYDPTKRSYHPGRPAPGTHPRQSGLVPRPPHQASGARCPLTLSPLVPGLKFPRPGSAGSRSPVLTAGCQVEKTPQSPDLLYTTNSELILDRANWQTTN